jgi:two-component system NarL family sensor kinase
MLERPPLQTISVHCKIESRLPPTAEGVLYRIAHEALMNAVKHSEASRVTLTLQCRRGEGSLSVEDDGRGGAIVADGDDGSDGHLGLAMARDRILLAGGTFELCDRVDGGTSLSVVLPITPQRQPDPDSRAARQARW